MTHDAFVSLALNHDLLVPKGQSPKLLRPALLHGSGAADGDEKVGSKKKGGGGGRAAAVARHVVSAFDSASAVTDSKKLAKVAKPAHLAELIKTALTGNFLFKHLEESRLDEVRSCMLIIWANHLITS